MAFSSCLTKKMETTASIFNRENLMERTIHRCGVAETSKGERVW